MTAIFVGWKWDVQSRSNRNRKTRRPFHFGCSMGVRNSIHYSCIGTSGIYSKIIIAISWSINFNNLLQKTSGEHNLCCGDVVFIFLVLHLSQNPYSHFTFQNVS